MALISPSYRAQNAELHKRPTYGAGGIQYLAPIVDVMREVNPQTVLDYGCGKGTLGKHFRRRFPHIGFHEYDPVTRPETPEPADLVICTDVLEHIEPDCLQAVLDHLQELTLNAGFFVIATRKANKTLPDGRNAHLIVEHADWWRDELVPRWRIDHWMQSKDEVETVVRLK